MTELIFVAVVAARVIIPLFIPRFPLPAIVAALIVDAVDQTIFQTFTNDPLDWYQTYDKALDIFYLAIAYMSAMRNWREPVAFDIARLLFVFRLIGVALFEATHHRWILLVFPNTFEYFFIAYETVRTKWNPFKLAPRMVFTIAASIWVFIKLPQEWWIHIARLDFTDVVAENSWVAPTLVAALCVLALVYWFAIRPRLPQPDWSWRFVADPLPEDMDTVQEQAAWHARFGAIWSWETFEKVFLVGLLSVTFAKSLPGVKATSLQLFVGVAVVVLANAFFTLVMARRSWTIAGIGKAFLVRMVANVVLVVVADWLLAGGSGGGDLDTASTLFFLTLISLVTTLHDRYWPVFATRRREELPAGMATYSGPAQG